MPKKPGDEIEYPNGEKGVVLEVNGKETVSAPYENPHVDVKTRD